MSWTSRVVWSEGMFLRTQHFQQLDRHIGHLVTRRTEQMVPHGWGIESLLIDTERLNIGKFAVVSARGVLPDGTTFSFPDEMAPPAPLDIAETVKNKLVHLSIPVLQPGNVEIALDDKDESTARFIKRDVEIADTIVGFNERNEIQIAEPRLRYVVDGPDLAGFVLLPLARIVEVRGDRSVVLDDQFIAPCLSLEAQPALAGFAADIEGRLYQRAEALAGRVTGDRNSGVGEITDLLLLQLVNRAYPLLHHLLDNAHSYHPERLYCELTALAGELATFTSETRRASAYPGYRHTDLQSSFTPVMADLRRFLGTVLAPTAIPIPLEKKKFGFQAAIVADTRLFAEATFVIAARSRMAADEVGRLIPSQLKFGPGTKIAELVNSALPGIRLRHVGAPRQLPYSGNAVHFELDRGDGLWKAVSGPNGIGGLALHVGTELADVEIELWAIRDVR